ncbi:PaaI family thioesterase [Williamsia muralis]|uniref:Acyl-coenzyme A thioesterase THEM4 n=1 Tax=Williamsia marianensis TaxID=85044 RepID=A0A2G3PM74_WILMA|nr:PaaI family thioesterase [Williamsia marianensis]PHV66856.1 thioesterase [Williamsia marianensis]PZT99765.1 MAG: PaaI family thioesterase [Gordonia sp. (in: high G+C Gram-positive bacteria)]
MVQFLQEDLSDDEIARLRGVFEPLAVAVRDLVDATIRTTVDEETVRTVQSQIEQATAQLRTQQIDGSYGVRITPSGLSMPWGNAVVGVRNALAPPLKIHHDREGEAWSEFHLGAAYEGPPGMVHGGVCAMVLDHILGETSSHGKRTKFTGTIEVKYLRATPLGPVRADAWIDRIEGIKTYVVGTLSDQDGVTAEARGVFIVPKWAREPGE